MPPLPAAPRSVVRLFRVGDRVRCNPNLTTFPSLAGRVGRVTRIVAHNLAVAVVDFPDEGPMYPPVVASLHVEDLMIAGTGVEGLSSRNEEGSRRHVKGK